MNDYRQKGIARTLTDDELLDGIATFVQLALFPSTPPAALTTQTATGTLQADACRVAADVRRRCRRAPANAEPTANTVQRILDAGDETFAVEGSTTAACKTCSGRGSGAARSTGTSTTRPTCS